MRRGNGFAAIIKSAAVGAQPLRMRQRPEGFAGVVQQTERIVIMADVPSCRGLAYRGADIAPKACRTAFSEVVAVIGTATIAVKMVAERLHRRLQARQHLMAAEYLRGIPANLRILAVQCGEAFGVGLGHRHHAVAGHRNINAVWVTIEIRAVDTLMVIMEPAAVQRAVLRLEEQDQHRQSRKQQGQDEEYSQRANHILTMGMHDVSDFLSNEAAHEIQASLLMGAWNASVSNSLSQKFERDIGSSS